MTRCAIITTGYHELFRLSAVIGAVSIMIWVGVSSTSDVQISSLGGINNYFASYAVFPGFRFFRAYAKI